MEKLKVNKIETDIQEVLIAFPELSMAQDGNLAIITGALEVDVIVNDTHIIDKFSIEISINEDYPTSLPVIREIDNRIRKRFPHVYTNMSLCLATETDMRFNLMPEYKLLNWMNKFAVPYFVTFSYYEKYGVFPFGDRSHGNDGIIEFYMDLFKLNNRTSAKELLRYICKKTYKGHHICPCGSGERIRDCHKEVVWNLQNDDFIKLFSEDLDLLTKG